MSLYNLPWQLFGNNFELLSLSKISCHGNFSDNNLELLEGIFICKLFPWIRATIVFPHKYFSGCNVDELHQTMLARIQERNAEGGVQERHLKRLCSPQVMTANGSEAPFKLAAIKSLAASSFSWTERHAPTSASHSQEPKRVCQGMETEWLTNNSKPRSPSPQGRTDFFFEENKEEQIKAKQKRSRH